MRFVTSSGFMPPRAAVASQFFFMTPRPRSSCSWPISMMVTGMPALANDIEMPPPMVPAPMMATLLDLARLGVGGNAGHLRGLALGEERVALRLRLIAGHQLDELLALEGNAFLERALQRLLDALGAGERRDQAAVALVGGSRSLGEDLRIGLGGGELGVVVAHALQRAFLGQHLLGESHAGIRRIALEQVVDEADLHALVALDRIAGDDHLHGLGRPDHARQPLGAAGARQQAELHLGQAEVGVLGRDAEMAAQRGLETAAERIAVDRRDDRPRRVFQRVENFMQARRLRRLAELADVGAGDEAAAGAGQHDGLDAGVVLGLGELFLQADANRVAQRIDRRIVDGEDENSVTIFGFYGFTHASLPDCFALRN